MSICKKREHDNAAMICHLCYEDVVAELVDARERIAEVEKSNLIAGGDLSAALLQLSEAAEWRKSAETVLADHNKLLHEDLKGQGRLGESLRDVVVKLLAENKCIHQECLIAWNNWGKELEQTKRLNGLYKSALDWICGYAHIRGIKDIEDRCAEVTGCSEKREGRS